MRLRANEIDGGLPIVFALVAAVVPMPSRAQASTGAIASPDLVFEGLVQVDANVYDSDVADLDGGAAGGNDADYRLRRAQLYVKGKAPGRLDWVLGYDVRAQKWLDLNVRHNSADGRQSVRAGQFKQPNGLERLSASRHNDFMSQAMVTNTFSIGRRVGVAYSIDHPYGLNADDGEAGQQRHGTWGFNASYFGRELTSGLARGSGFGMRGTWAVVTGTDRILHVGLSYVDHDTPADTLRLRARPNADLTDVRLVDTGTMTDTDRLSTLGVEAFWANGPFKLQAEYMTSSVDRIASPDFTGAGGYLSGVWNVTGQTWAYTGGQPVTRTGDGAGAGMWQLGLRYDVLDLDDDAVQGGRMETWTAGVNWYWRSYFKLVLNYVHVDSERAGIADDPGIAEARLQFYW